ncbi:bifunctional methylenetetrahydrofolate dehydrogenase/methenyltetrahydrofolate cyclohydrolase FolD [Porphyromonas miyakawae]|uniref:Bifunctional protein FolD n=1 Tax=Porphyromonas miyakawae TaxID=3137470 RepID=A0ABQ0E2B9_9PORP
MYQILDGRKVSSEIKEEIRQRVAEIVAKGGRRPHLAAVLVGHDGGSETYVASKVKACEEVGFASSLISFDENITEEQLLQEVDRLNNNPDIDGYIVQLPLPKHIDEQKVMERIDFRKDVDGFHPINVGRTSIGLPSFLSATPQGILELLNRYHIDTNGMHAVVIGRSNIVGKPIATLLMRKAQPGNCTVTVCHSATKNMKEICQSADLIVAALGKPEFLKEDMVKEGAVVIDVGTTRVPDSTRKSGYKLTGDVDFDRVAPKCSYITPVPGGVGPMTIVSLMMNTIKAYTWSYSKEK